MKKQSFFLPTLIVCSFFMLAGCGKDKETAPVKTKTELATQGSWNFNRATSSGLDISSNISACYKDNVVTFTSATNGTVNEGANVCTTPAPATFTWMFLSNETVLSLSAPLFVGSSGNFAILSLTETEMVISQDVIVPPSTTPVNVVFYYKH